MRTDRIPLALGAFFIAFAVSFPAQAIDPADKCEALKVKEAGKYHFCRLSAEAKAIKKGLPPDFAKCDGKLDLKWGRIESKAAGACPVTGDLSVIRLQVIEQADTTLASIGGTPAAECVAPPSSTRPSATDLVCMDLETAEILGPCDPNSANPFSGAGCPPGEHCRTRSHFNLLDPNGAALLGIPALSARGSPLSHVLVCK